MTIPRLNPVYDPLLDFIYERATVEDILNFDLPEATQQRAIELLERQDDDHLTAEEADELEQMRQVNRMVSALKARALAGGTSRHD